MDKERLHGISTSVNVRGLVGLVSLSTRNIREVSGVSRVTGNQASWLCHSTKCQTLA